MNRNRLYESLEQIDDDILERSEHRFDKKKLRRIARAAVAVAGAAAVAAGVFMLAPRFTGLRLYAIAEAEYPEMARYPNEWAPTFEADYDAWKASKQQFNYFDEAYNGKYDSLDAVLSGSVGTLLSGAGDDNVAASPVNLYIALAMLAEICDGDSRQQILDYVGIDDMDSLRELTREVWQGHYSNDGATTSILASSIWLDDEVSVDKNVMNTLAEYYYASSYQGDMSSEKYSGAYRDWLNRETGGLLKNQIDDKQFDAESLLALATTVYYQAKWDIEFDAADNTDGIFHSAVGDVETEFMFSRDNGRYFWADKFGAVYKALENRGGNMWFILPDEGVTIDELLADPQLGEFIAAGAEWENQKQLMINLSLPKYDLTSRLDIKEKLRELGIEAVFDPNKAEFSAVKSDYENPYISSVDHSVRVTVDEEGVSAAAYTEMMMLGAAMPPDEEIDFTLDRPFIFVLESYLGLPLFVGVVNQP